MGRPAQRRFGAVLAVASALVVLVVAPVSAHSESVRSDPPNGGMVSEGRTSLTLWFDEPVSVATSTFRLRTLAGLEVSSSVSFDDDGEEVVITTAPLERGQYALDWHALSLTDGHASSGTVVFGAGLRPDVVAAVGGGVPSVAVVVLRWLDLGVLLLALGTLSVGGRVLGAAGRGAEALRHRVRWWGVCAGWATLCAGLVTPLLRTRGSEASPSAWAEQTWLTLTRTGWGQLWLVREVALLVAVVALTRWWSTRGASATVPRVAAGALAAAVLLQSWGGHAAALPSGSGVAAVMGAGHVLASGVWAGGLIVLVVTLVPAMRRAPSWHGTRLAVWRAYSPRAAVASVVLLGTGLYQAGHHVPDLASLRGTVYGEAVAVKVLLVALALALAAANTMLVNPGIASRVGSTVRLRLSRSGPDTLARTLAAEAAVLVLAVLAAAVLTSVPTAREAAVATRPSAPDVATVDGLFMTFEAVPAGSGETRLILRMRSTIQPEPAPVDSVEVLLEGPEGEGQPVSLGFVEEGRYEASTQQLPPGDWRGTVAVRRAGLPDARMTSDWVVVPGGDDLDGPLRWVTASLSWLLLLGLASLLLWSRRRPRPPRGREQVGEPEPRSRSLVRSLR